MGQGGKSGYGGAVMKASATVPFRHRGDLSYLDAVAHSLGGVRGSTEFRPCYAMVHPDVPAHDARYLFQGEEEARAFAAQLGGTVDSQREQTSCEQVVTIPSHPQCDCDRMDHNCCVRSLQAE